MKRTAWGVCALLMGLHATDARADGGVLELTEVLRSVDVAFPTSNAARADVQIAQGEQLAAEGGFDLSWKTKASMQVMGYYAEQSRVDSYVERPTSLWGTTFFAGWRYGQGKFPVYYKNYETLDAGEARAGVNIPLLRNGPTDRRRTSLERASLGLEAAQLGAKQQRLELRRAAAGRYWAWVASGKRLQVAQDLMQVAVERDKALEQRVKAGEIPNVERTENARSLEQRRAQVAIAQRALEQAAIELGMYMRDERGDMRRPGPERLPSDLPVAADSTDQPEAAARLAASLRPEPKRFALQRRQFGAELAFTKNQLMPALDLQIVGSKDFGHNNPDRPDLRDPVLEVSLMLDIPIETRALRGRRDAALAGAVKLAAQEKLANDRVKADVDDALSARRAARERVKAAIEEVRLAVIVEKAERIRFDNGDGNMLIVNQREQLTAEARLRELEARLDVLRADVDLTAATGQLPDNG